MLTARTKTIEWTGTGRQFSPSLASLSATNFSLQIYMELTGIHLSPWPQLRWAMSRSKIFNLEHANIATSTVQRKEKYDFSF